ncbi:Collectin-12 [Mizuhopecten yessoensis]|uniref:Collectin-12 n=1 Tax=Mizuhopecten yessoensis TaxID=6573 RepID=A0A210QI24_MIZYE|nr:Collectin-12 [Mizuhopecten yessoensis]
MDLIDGIWSVWVGGSDAQVENTWLWITSGLPMSFTNWESPQPDNWGGGAQNADCLCMGRWSTFIWHDCNCFENRAFVCEKLVMLRNL